MKVDLAHVSEGWEVMIEGSHIWWGLCRVDKDIMGQEGCHTKDGAQANPQFMNGPIYQERRDLRTHTPLKGPFRPQL